MASQMLGRCECPECGFHAAHVKIKIDKEGKHPYRHCPECGAQYFPRSKEQGDRLREKMRAEKQPEPNTPSEGEAGMPTGAAEIVPPPVQTASEKKYKMVFGVRVPLEGATA